MTGKKLIKLILDSFAAEKDGDIERGISLIAGDFRVIEMFIGSDDRVFPIISGQELRDAMAEVYKIKGREYVFKNIAADEKKGIVFVEFIESYADPETGRVYRTPQVAVIEVKSGKLYRTRHYTDPRLSYKYLSEEEVDKAFG